MARLAFTTFAIMKAPYGDPVVRGFETRTPAVFQAAAGAPGFIARAREIDDLDHLTNFERDWGSWGRFAVPSFYDGGYDTVTDTRASTLSLWRDIPSVRAFAYDGIHREALSRRIEWFRKPAWPSCAMWWVADDATPTWSDAAIRLDRLHAQGPSASAFTFARCFGPEGEPMTILEQSRHGGREL